MKTKAGSDSLSIPMRRRVLTLIVGVITAGVLVLIVGMLFSDFPGPPPGSAHNADAPPENVRGG